MFFSCSSCTFHVVCVHELHENILPVHVMIFIIVVHVVWSQYLVDCVGLLELLCERGSKSSTSRCERESNRVQPLHLDTPFQQWLCFVLNLGQIYSPFEIVGVGKVEQTNQIAELILIALYIIYYQWMTNESCRQTGALYTSCIILLLCSVISLGCATNFTLCFGSEFI